MKEEINKNVVLTKGIRDMKKKVCKHFWLPHRILFVPKYEQHDTKNYDWRDALEIVRVYCAKCGKNCYSDLSDLKE